MKKSVLTVALVILCGRGVCLAEEKPKIDLDRVIITPSKIQQAYRESTANMSIIESRDIEDSGVEEVHQILETLPSVDIIEYGSNGATKTIHTRGAANSQVVTLIDGRVTNTPRDGITDFNKLPLNNIERIEVLRGPAASIYGANAIGGVINIITKSGKKEKKNEAEVKYGTQDTRIVNLLTQDEIENLSWLFSGGWRRSSGFRENSDYKAWNADANLMVDIDDENSIRFASGYWKSKLGTPGNIANEDPDDRQNAWSDYVDVSWSGALWNDSDTYLKLYQSADRLEFLESTAPYDIAAHTTKIYGATFQVSQMWLDIFRTTMGIDGQEHKINSSSSAKHRYNVKAGYIETEFEPTEDINVKAGARSDDYSNFGDRFSPSVSFSWRLFDKAKLHGLWAKSFRTPTFNDLYWPQEDWGAWGGVEGNAALKPETAKSYEIGMGASLFGALETDVTYFHNKFKDLIA